MKKLNDEQIERLKKWRKEGYTKVYRTLRKWYTTWYVAVFSIDELLEKKAFPSYFYKEKGITETQARKLDNVIWFY